MSPQADSLLRVLRHGLETPLPLTAVKSRMGYATEAAGVASTAARQANLDGVFRVHRAFPLILMVLPSFFKGVSFMFSGFSFICNRCPFIFKRIPLTFNVRWNSPSF